MRRVAAWRLSEMNACVSSVGAGAPLGREAIQRSARSKLGDRSSNPLGLLARAQPRARSPNSVCCLIQPISVERASASRLVLSSKRAASSKKMKLRRTNSSGTILFSTGRHTIGAKRLLRDAANVTSLSATSEATESGLRTNTTVSARTISASMRFHHSSKA
jgi:hypothetical protein